MTIHINITVTSQYLNTVLRDCLSFNSPNNNIIPNNFEIFICITLCSSSIALNVTSLVIEIILPPPLK